MIYGQKNPITLGSLLLIPLSPKFLEAHDATSFLLITDWLETGENQLKTISDKRSNHCQARL